jgi:hypothetical protein
VGKQASIHRDVIATAASDICHIIMPMSIIRSLPNLFLMVLGPEKPKNLLKTA